MLFLNTDEVEAFTLQDLEVCIRRLKRRKAKDDSGITAELLKDASPEFLQLVPALFNDVLYSHAPPPDAWRKTRLTVIFKKGDPEIVSNYRPIAIVPILYKLFSRLLCNRISKIVIPQQSPEQAAYEYDALA